MKLQAAARLQAAIDVTSVLEEAEKRYKSKPTKMSDKGATFVVKDIGEIEVLVGSNKVSVEFIPDFSWRSVSRSLFHDASEEASSFKEAADKLHAKIARDTSHHADELESLKYSLAKQQKVYNLYKEASRFI